MVQLHVVLFLLGALSKRSLGELINQEISCSKLLPGQYKCNPPVIDKKTQQPRNCSSETLTALGQYKCNPPVIDKKTQQPRNCSSETLTALGKCAILKFECEIVECKPAPGIRCSGRLFTGHEVGFQKEVSCNFVSGYRFDSVLILSVFGGVFGLDRFYLGYPALACLKVATVGGFGLWYLWDIFFIATGVS
ncbi:TM2 domain-containing protein 1 [Fasciolopsis buskii]|uniref:TM2 domain-containing protein 1 n=1 Tax=Fasciolopsis buskii TaxID=27845 RepID=A0A8E0RKK4_9TREM|nr:TM2 domain-containing protein 1 [Fasciolopsis buski]